MRDTSDIADVLSLRLQLAKSSVKKYQAMENAVCLDSRCHGMFQFYGANRSGRWAGRLVQLQNLPQNHMPETADEYLGFFQDTKIQALKDASQTLSNSNFDRPTYFQERIASNLSHEMQPYNTVQLRRAIQSTIFPSYHGKLHGKEQRALANSIFQGLKDAPTEEKTKILADLACGGEKRQERIQSLQQTKALSR